MRTELPTGTVTFLFTDIEGSTRLLQELGDAYAETLAEHRRVLREAFAGNGGVEVDTQGDAFFVAFGRASAALAAAAAGQAALAAGPVRVRMGLHTGEPVVTEEGYIGVDVHRGARIAAAGHGGQVLLSESTRALVEGDLRDLGEHRLKDLLEPQRLFQLGSAEFPPVTSLNWTNLPVQATPLVGRERELEEAAALLRDRRVLTLVGPPGAGKTRVALQLAAEVADGFDHVWWVPLQDARDPELVEPTIAQAVGARGDLGGYLRGRRALMLLDNMEQVVGFGPRLAEIVASSPKLSVLVTSREPMHVTVEQQYPVPPLAERDAVVLFHERARAVRPDFAADDAVPAICRRLDGLPLAIELAAARVKLFRADALLARLEQRLQLLTGGARDLPERQRTLTATIAWSYDLLGPDEQELLARLSVFAGGWTLEAAEAVCACDVDTLASLVDKSLVREQDGRFSMLETIREYALERLAEHDRRDDVRRRHAVYFLAQAEEHSGELFEMLDQRRLEWFERENDNLRAALDWLHDHGATPEQELRLAVACEKLWIRRGRGTEGLRRVTAALDHAADAPALLRARLLRIASRFCWHEGDYERGREAAEAAIALHLELGTDGREPVATYTQLAICELRLGNRERAVELYTTALATAHAAGIEPSVAAIQNHLGQMALLDRDFVLARRHFEESLAMYRRLKDTVASANSLIDLGFTALALQRPDDAVDSFRESLAMALAERVADLLVWAAEGVAAAVAERRAEDAVSLLAATLRARADLGYAGEFYPIADEFRERTLVAARSQLSEAAFAAAWREGEALSPEAAAELAAALVD